MDKTKVLRMLVKGMFPFEEYKPLQEHGGEFRLIGSAGCVSISRQTQSRSAVEIDDRYFTKSAYCFFTDFGFGQAQVVGALESIPGVRVLSQREFDIKHDLYRDAQRKQFSLMSFEDALTLRQTHETYIFPGVSPDPGNKIDVSAARVGEYSLNPRCFKEILRARGLPPGTDEQFVFELRPGYTIEGTPGYVLCDRAAARPQKGNCKEWEAFCNLMGLKPVAANYRENAVKPLDSSMGI
jgi:hypothetical protein